MRHLGEQDRFIEPSLKVFAEYWLDVSPEIQQSARMLFDYYLARMSDKQVLAVLERWYTRLPDHDHDHAQESEKDEELAVLLVGLIGVRRLNLLRPVTLRRVSTAVFAYLKDGTDLRRQGIAAELCSLGFENWQGSVDAVELMRVLFNLASGRGEKTSADLRNLARLATLHVATVNKALFMSTLSFDILNAQSALQRTSTMRLLGFMVRKKPLVLHSSLPRLAEAVVKSLDPTVTALRETVQQTATVILSELVRTYPSIDFHAKSQRLAVGTQEGAAIIYDLKSATRLYVLEGHKLPVTSLSFSPDGRRLVTVSLDESRLLAWKVGSTFFNLFNPGAVPRQGGATGDEPYKTYDFNVGDEGCMTVAATLEWLAFEWPAPRTARLRIRSSALSFDVD